MVWCEPGHWFDSRRLANMQEVRFWRTSQWKVFAQIYPFSFFMSRLHCITGYLAGYPVLSLYPVLVSDWISRYKERYSLEAWTNISAAPQRKRECIFSAQYCEVEHNLYNIAGNSSNIILEEIHSVYFSWLFSLYYFLVGWHYLFSASLHSVEFLF